MDAREQFENYADAVRRAEKASALLQNPTLSAALAALEAGYLRAFRSSAPDQQAVREEAYSALRALDRLRSDLESTARDGEVAAHNNRRALAAQSEE